MYDIKCHLSYFAATANQELAPDVKSARGIRESVDTTEIDTPRCQPQVCCTNGGRRGKKWQAVWNTVGSDSAAHITPQVSSSVFDQKHLASCTLKQTRHSQLMCFGLTWLLVTSKHWQRADRADSMFYVCKLGQKIIRISCHLHQRFHLHSAVLLYVTMLLTSQDNTPVHFKGQVLDLQKCLVLFWRFGGNSALQMFVWTTLWFSCYKSYRQYSAMSTCGYMYLICLFTLTPFCSVVACSRELTMWTT